MRGTTTRATREAEIVALVELPALERVMRLAELRAQLVPARAALDEAHRAVEALEVRVTELELADRLAALQVLLDERGPAYVTECGQHLAAVFGDGRLWCSCGARRDEPGDVERRQSAARWHVEHGPMGRLL